MQRSLLFFPACCCYCPGQYGLSLLVMRRSDTVRSKWEWNELAVGVMHAEKLQVVISQPEDKTRR
jgi:hypothetical protein